MKASFSETVIKYSQMPTRFSTGNTTQYPECHAYKMATEKLLHILNLYDQFMKSVKVNLRQ